MTLPFFIQIFSPFLFFTLSLAFLYEIIYDITSECGRNLQPLSPTFDPSSFEKEGKQQLR